MDCLCFCMISLSKTRFLTLAQFKPMSAGTKGTSKTAAAAFSLHEYTGRMFFLFSFLFLLVSQSTAFKHTLASNVVVWVDIN